MVPVKTGLLWKLVAILSLKSIDHHSYMQSGDFSHDFLVQACSCSSLVMDITCLLYHVACKFGTK